MINESNSWTCLQSQAADSLESRCLNSCRLDNRGLAYGDGFFTTMGVIDGAILWQEYHSQRIRSHAQALQLDIDNHALLASLQAHAQQLQQGMLKLIVTRAPQTVRGYGFLSNDLGSTCEGSACEIWLKKTAMPIATAEQAHLPDGRTVLMQPSTSAACLTAQIACLPPPLVGLKSLNRLDSVLASGELQRIKAMRPSLSKELGEGLVRDMTGSWVEGTMSNVFYQLANEQQPLLNPTSSDDSNANYLLTGQWYTPPLTQSGVTGVLRQVIIDAFALTEQPVIMRSLNDGDLSNITQMFFCNAVRGVMPVERLIND